MKGVHFYEVLLKKDRTRGHKNDKSSGNCLAVFYETRRWDERSKTMLYDAVASIYSEDHGPNLPVASTAVGHRYIEQRCRRVTEKEARAIHPRLFLFLDDEGDPQGDRLALTGEEYS